MNNNYTIDLVNIGGGKQQIFIVLSEHERRRVGNIRYQLNANPHFYHTRQKDYGALADLIGVEYFKEVVQCIFRAIMKLPQSVNKKDRFQVEIEMPAMAV